MSALNPFLRAVERRLVLEREEMMAARTSIPLPEPKPQKARKPRPRVTPERRDAIVSLYTSGVTVVDITKRLAITRNAAYWTLKRAGVLTRRPTACGPRPGARLTREERKARDAEIVRRSANGESARALAAEYQLTMRGIEHVRRRMRRAAP